MINRFALSFLCIELDRNEICEVMLLYILLAWQCLGEERFEVKDLRRRGNVDGVDRVYSRPMTMYNCIIICLEK